MDIFGHFNTDGELKGFSANIAPILGALLVVVLTLVGLFIVVVFPFVGWLSPWVFKKTYLKVMFTIAWLMSLISFFTYF